MSSQTPRREQKRGSNLSGTNGTANRTYSMSYSGYIAGTIIIYVQGTYQYENADFTISGTTITLLNIVFDADYVDITYWTSNNNGSASAPRYATTLSLAKVLGIMGRVPTLDAGVTPAKELVGTGDNSALQFYLDFGKVLTSSYVLYYGSAATTTTTLTEGTHYTLDLETGTITLTTTGRTLLGTNNMYATYKYTTKDVTDDDLATALLQAEAKIDSNLNTTFIDGTATNPQYQVRIDVLRSQGLYNNSYFVSQGPIVDLNTTLATTITATATSLDITGDHLGTDFPLAGTIVIDTEKITYTGVTSNTLTGLTRGTGGSSAAAHTAGAAIHTTIVEASVSPEGNDPSWSVLQWNTQVYVNENGNVYIYQTPTTSATVSINRVPPRVDVPNRIKITYLWGSDSIPADITRLALITAKQQLTSDTVGAALYKGYDEFSPSMMNADQKEIDSITDKYRRWSIGRV